MTIPAPAFQLPAHVQPAAPPPTAAPAIPMEELTEKYRALRDKVDSIETLHSSQLKPFKDAMKEIEGMVQKQLVESGASSIRTAGGTAILSTKQSISVADPEAFRQWAEANGTTSFYENRVSKEAVEEYISKGNQLPPGLKSSSIQTVQIRKPTAKGK